MELTKKKKNLVKLAEKKGNASDLLLLDMLQELEDKMEEMEKKHKEEMDKMPKMMYDMMPEMPDTHKVSIEGAELITIKGERGDKGDAPSEERLQELITPLIPEPLKGADGKDGKDGKNGLDGLNGLEGKDGLNGKDGVDGKDGLDAKPAKEWTKEELIELIRPLITTQRAGFFGGRVRDLWIDQVPTGTIDGANKTFTISTNCVQDSESVFVDGVRMSKARDYTLAGKTLTFITAPLLTVDVKFQKL